MNKNKLTILVMALGLVWGGAAIAAPTPASSDAPVKKGVSFGGTNTVHVAASTRSPLSAEVTPEIYEMAQNLVQQYEGKIAIDAAKVKAGTMDSFDAEAYKASYNKTIDLYSGFKEGERKSISEQIKVVSTELGSLTIKDIVKFSPTKVSAYLQALDGLTAEVPNALTELNGLLKEAEDLDASIKADNDDTDSARLGKLLTNIDSYKDQIRGINSLEKLKNGVPGEALVKTLELQKSNPTLFRAYADSLELEPIEAPAGSTDKINEAVEHYNSTVADLQALTDKLTGVGALQIEDGRWETNHTYGVDSLDSQIENLKAIGEKIINTSTRISGRSRWASIVADVHKFGRAIPGLRNLLPSTDEEILNALQSQLNDTDSAVGEINTTIDSESPPAKVPETLGSPGGVVTTHTESPVDGTPTTTVTTAGSTTDQTHLGTPIDNPVDHGDTDDPDHVIPPPEQPETPSE